MSSEDQKRAAAEAALAYVEPEMVVGVGTGSTVRYFIEGLARIKGRIDGAVSSSEASTKLLKRHGIPVLELNATGDLPLYVDGADESNRRLELIKGGGGALTREKILAGASETFVCIAERSKLVDVLGAFPLPVEVIPMARSFVARAIQSRGGQPVLREGLVTDNGNLILDVHGLRITEPERLERDLNQIPGVVTAGIFAIRPAERLLLGGPEGVEEIRR